jgi:hypothetical protein
MVLEPLSAADRKRPVGTMAIARSVELLAEDVPADNTGKHT